MEERTHDELSSTWTLPGALWPLCMALIDAGRLQLTVSPIEHRETGRSLCLWRAMGDSQPWPEVGKRHRAGDRTQQWQPNPGHLSPCLGSCAEEMSVCWEGRA